MNVKEIQDRVSVVTQFIKFVKNKYDTEGLSEEDKKELRDELEKYTEELTNLQVKLVENILKKGKEIYD